MKNEIVEKDVTNQKPGSLVFQGGLPSPADFNAYSHAVSAIPMLSEDDERGLLTSFEQDGNLEAAGRLTWHHLRMVPPVVRSMSGYGLPPADLVQEGNIGLMKAIKNYRSGRGSARFGSWALVWIRSEIQDYILRNWRMVRVGTGKVMKKLFFGLRREHARLDEQKDGPVTVSSLSKSMSVPERDIVDMTSYMRSRDEMVMDGEVASENGIPEHHGMVLVDETTPLDHLLENEHATSQGKVLTDGLAALSPRERTVIVSRFLDEPPKTLSSIALEWGVSAERVRQMEKSALKKLRQGTTTAEYPVSLDVDRRA